jgi:RNA-directed DNA polymerase
MKRRLLRMQDAFELGKLPAEEITERIRCWIAHAKHADTFRLRERLLMNFPFRRPNQIDDEA